MTLNGKGALNEEDIEFMRSGVLQILPPDSQGRLVTIFHSTGIRKGLSLFRTLVYHVTKLAENDASRTHGVVSLMHFVGKAEEGLSHIETAMRLNPRFPFWYYFALGANQFHLTRFEAAEASFLKSIDRNPRWRANHLYLVSTYGHLERPDDAEWEMDELRALGFDPTMANWQAIDKIQDPVYRERFFEGLRKAGVPES